MSANSLWFFQSPIIPTHLQWLLVVSNGYKLSAVVFSGLGWLCWPSFACACLQCIDRAINFVSSCLCLSQVLATYCCSVVSAGFYLPVVVYVGLCWTLLVLGDFCSFLMVSTGLCCISVVSTGFWQPLLVLCSSFYGVCRSSLICYGLQWSVVICSGVCLCAVDFSGLQ